MQKIDYRIFHQDFGWLTDMVAHPLFCAVFEKTEDEATIFNTPKGAYRIIRQLEKDDGLRCEVEKLTIKSRLFPKLT